MQFIFQPSPPTQPTLNSICIPNLSLYTTHSQTHLHSKSLPPHTLSQFSLHSNSFHLHNPLSILFTFQTSPLHSPLNSIYIPTLSLYTTHSHTHLYSKSLPPHTLYQFSLHSNPVPLHNPLSIQFTFQIYPSTQPTLNSVYISSNRVLLGSIIKKDRFKMAAVVGLSTSRSEYYVRKEWI